MTTALELLDDDLANVARVLRGVTVSVRVGRQRAVSSRHRDTGGHGAGIVWSPDGTIVTNAHVVADASAALITFADGRTSEAAVVARNPRRDLALLRADTDRLGGAPLPAAVIGDPSQLRPGDLILALGHPLGVEHALAMGIMHAAPDARRSPYIAADIRLAPGNSGGPLADSRGRIVGVNSMIVQGLGVAISADAVIQFIEASAPRPTLGVQLRPVRVRIPATSATSLGLLVLTVDPAGAAGRAGLLQGDILLGHAGRSFASHEELTSLLRAAGPGALLRFDVGRGGRRVSCEVLLDAMVGNAKRAA
jgi:serine protease Do